jgi:hypothetical protein
MQLPITSHRKLETLIKEAIEREDLDEEFEKELREYLESANTAELPSLFPFSDKEVTKRIASVKKKVAEALSGAQEEVSGDTKKHQGGGGPGGGRRRRGREMQRWRREREKRRRPPAVLLLQLHLPLWHVPPELLPQIFNRGYRLRRNYRRPSTLQGEPDRMLIQVLTFLMRLHWRLEKGRTEMKMRVKVFAI